MMWLWLLGFSAMIPGLLYVLWYILRGKKNYIKKVTNEKS